MRYNYGDILISIKPIYLNDNHPVYTNPAKVPC